MARRLYLSDDEETVLFVILDLANGCGELNDAVADGHLKAKPIKKLLAKLGLEFVPDEDRPTEGDSNG